MPNILLTRPKDRSEAFAKEIEQCGWRSTIWPLLTIRPLLTAPIRPRDGQTLIFTSVNAVAATPDPAPLSSPVICVGNATAAAARARGFRTVTDVDGDARKLIQTLLNKAPQRYLHIRGVDTRGDIATTLTRSDRPTDEAIAYEAVASNHVPKEIDAATMGGEIDAVALFSPRSAAILRELVGVAWLSCLSTVTVFAISPSAAEPVQDMGFANVVVAKKPNGSEMRAAICSAANE